MKVFGSTSAVNTEIGEIPQAIGSDPIPIEASDSSDLGTLAAQDADNVAITGGSITGLTELSVDDLQLDGSDIFTPDAATPSDININSGSNNSSGSGSGINLETGSGIGTGKGGDCDVVTGQGTIGGPSSGYGRRSGDISLATGAGATSGSTLAGGRSGDIILNTGSGGANTAAESTGNGGMSGSVILSTAAGGDTNSTGTGTGGDAGTLTISTGDGGNATAGTGSGGSGGNIVITCGTGGTSAGGTPGTDGKIVLNSPLRIDSGNVPSAATDPGDPGDLAWDASFFYVCVAVNTWVRAALSTW